MQGCLSYRKPSDGERHIFVGDGKSVEVEEIGHFRLLLGTGFYLDLKDTFVVPSFRRNLVSVPLLDVFKTYKAEVENQLNKKIKNVRSDRGGKYYGRYDGSGEQCPGPFTKFLEECGIVPQYTMPGSPSMNGVAEDETELLRIWPHEKKLSSKTISSYFIGYSERSRGYKFYDPIIKNIFETGTVTFFEDVEFGGRNKIRDIAFEEELDSNSIPTITFDDVQVLIPIIDQEVNPEPLQDNVEQIPIRNEVIVPEEQTQQPQEQVPLRKSTRERRNAIPDDYIVFLQEHEDNNGMMEDDPINFHQAMKSSNSQKWIDAMKDEYKSMQDNKVWELVPLLEGAKPIGCKRIFKTKRDANGNVERYKARLVAKGYTQKEGIDFTETFSPVSSKDSFRIIMALVAHFDLELHQMDVKTAFLNGDIEETI
ncbi:hypothetical protein CXB51_007407 [Gossypium anomalum]|uniref:Integrase catalytic domain-containing protein n=1 Tax=Gossypium anomalum TaxID=47600 RepID=A0A8J5ZGP0_9ROSI|nr:hypothetical protein CXB51_007407 [Gossypium anomalum]